MRVQLNGGASAFQAQGREIGIHYPLQTNMKTIPYRRTWGNAKMKGLKECGLSCRCCVIFNDTEKRLLRHIDRETRQLFEPKTQELESLKHIEFIFQED